MGGSNPDINHFRFVLPLFLLLVLKIALIHAQEDPCKDVQCGKGTCVPDKGAILHYDCDCYPGWTKFQLGPITFPSCVMPNCTIDSHCGNGAPAPAPPPPLPLPSLNLSDPCTLVWCGDGTCVANGTQHYCQCYNGSSNLQNTTDLPCFEPCSLGADCNNLGLGPSITPPPPPPMNEDPCKDAQCGKGTCVPDKGAIPKYDCDCYSGWTKFQFGPVTFPSCVIPKCTIDYQCGNGGPPPPLLPPSFNLSDPCTLVWCGDGTCVANGTEHYCQCYDGSSNLLNITAFPCFEQCSLGPDCNKHELSPPITPPPPPPPPLPPPTNGSTNVSKCSRSCEAISFVLSVAISLAFVL